MTEGWEAEGEEEARDVEQGPGLFGLLQGTDPTGPNLRKEEESGGVGWL